MLETIDVGRRDHEPGQVKLVPSSPTAVNDPAIGLSNGLGKTDRIGGSRIGSRTCSEVGNGKHTLKRLLRHSEASGFEGLSTIANTTIGR